MLGALPKQLLQRKSAVPNTMATGALHMTLPRPICYSTTLRYVFIHIPKCAGTSIHRALGTLHDTRSLQPNIRKYHKHAKAYQVRDILGPIWQNCFKFSFVRNPWDLMVSSYHWWITHADAFPSLRPHIARIVEMGTFSRFIRSRYGTRMINEHYATDLMDWLTDGDAIIVDFIGRYENLSNDWQHVCESLGVPPVELTRENPVARQHYRQFYDDASRQLVAERFAKTITVFGYEF
jgi:Sulfotransferase family